MLMPSVTEQLFTWDLGIERHLFLAWISSHVDTKEEKKYIKEPSSYFIVGYEKQGPS